MSDADLLLNAIFDNPDDDTPRLVYADWLEEHGQEHYAQFIRLSIQAEGGSKPPAERKRLRDERFPIWQRIVSTRREAFERLQVTLHDYDRGICTKVVARAEDFANTASTWWPVITPPHLTVFDVRGWETAVCEGIRRHGKCLRALRCLSRPGMDVHDIDEYYFLPFEGSLLGGLAAQDSFPRLESLTASIAYADFQALRLLVDSKFCARLRSFWLEVRLPATDEYEQFSVRENGQPGNVLEEIRSFINRHAPVQ